MHPTESSQPVPAGPSLIDAAWERVRQIGPRSRRLLRSRAALANGVALIGILILRAIEVSGLASFVSVIALAVLLRSGREAKNRERVESCDTKNPTGQPS